MSNLFRTTLTNLIINPELIENCSWKPIIKELNKLGFENMYNDIYYCDEVFLDLETGEIQVPLEYNEETANILTSLIQKNIILKSND